MKSGPLPGRIATGLLRARSLTARELPWRVREQLVRQGERWRRPEGPPGADPSWPHLAAIAQTDSATRGAVEAEARSVIEGPLWLLGRRFDPRDHTAWRRDPDGGPDWPDAFAFDIDLVSRDPKPVWALHRLQHLQLLAWAACTGHAAAGDLARQQAASWVSAHPPGRGVGWASTLEVACRAVSLALVAAACPGAGLHAPLVQHGRWLVRHPSRYSSAANHRIAELGALALLGAIAACPEAAGWLRRGRRGLGEVLPTQVHPDGVGVEQSLAYLAFDLEWALLARAALQLRGGDLPRPALGALTSATRAIAAVADAGGNCPRIGDDDDGRALFVAQHEPRYPASVAGCAAAALGLPGVRSWSPDLRSALLGIRSAARPPATGSFTAPVGGRTALRSDGLLVVVDHGPLGWHHLGAHGHADALALWLHVDGHPVLVGCGTYAYRGAPAWRRWFRGTGAHNTLLVGGRDQSEQRGTFHWGRRARVRTRRVELRADGGRVDAEHDGYAARGGPHHRRRVEVAGGAVEVLDTLSPCSGPVEVALHWHVAPGLEVALQDGGVAIALGDRRLLAIELDPALPASVIEHAAAPGPGAHSPSYGVLCAAPCVRQAGALDRPWQVRTRLARG